MTDSNNEQEKCVLGFYAGLMQPLQQERKVAAEALLSALCDLSGTAGWTIKPKDDEPAVLLALPDGFRMYVSYAGKWEIVSPIGPRKDVRLDFDALNGRWCAPRSHAWKPAEVGPLVVLIEEAAKFRDSEVD